MNWFNGSIPEAILAAKERNGIFVVYVYDKSDSSKSAEETLNSGKILNILASTKFVSINLENGSEEAKQFAQIYPLIVVPSLFLIKGQTGIPLEVIGGNFSEENLLEKLTPLVDSAQNKVLPTTSTSLNKEEGLSEEAAATASTPSLKSLEEKDTQQSIPIESDPVSSLSAGEQLAEASTSNTLSSLSERVDRAKALLEEKQIEKEIEKQEDDKKKEMERRREGQGMAMAKQKREEEEMKELALQRRKDKQEDKIHREKVKAQIAADRLEREKREALFKNPPPTSPPPQEPQQPPQESNSSDTKIKFRFPDSSSMNAQFSSDDTLAFLRNHLIENSPMSLGNFKLVSILHHRAFTEEQMVSSLRELGLSPSATINVLPTASSIGSVIPSQGSFYDTFWSLLSPLLFILNYFKRFFGLSNPPEEEASPSEDREKSPNESSSSKRFKSEGSFTTRNRPKTAYGSRSEASKREGNIHRLNRKEDDEEDDNNTWNGNSTQQM